MQEFIVFYPGRRRRVRVRVKGFVGTIGMNVGGIGARRTGGSARAVDAGSSMATHWTGEATTGLSIVTKHGVT